MNLLTEFVIAAGLNELWQTVLDDWLGPIFIGAVAVFAIMFIKDRAWMKLVAFVGIAAVVAVLVFGGEALFGADGSLKNVGEDVAGEINTVVVNPTTL